LVSKALEYLDSLAKEAGDDPVLQNELAMAYRKVGDVQCGTVITSPNLGDMAGALKSYHAAAAIGEALIAAYPKDIAARRELATTYDAIGVLLGEGGGDPSGQLESYRKALALREALVASAPEDIILRQNLAVSEFRIGQALRNFGDVTGALEHYRKSQATYDAISQAESTINRLRAMAAIYGSIGAALAEAGDTTGALESLQQALEARKKLAEDPSNAVAQRDLAAAHVRIGDILGHPDWRNVGDLRGAEKSYRDALAIQEKLIAADQTNAVARRDLMLSHQKLGSIFASAGNRAGALQRYRTALTLGEELVRQQPVSATARSRLDWSWSHLYIANVLSLNGDTAPAEDSFRKVLTVVEQLSVTERRSAEVRHLLRRTLTGLAKLNTRVGRIGEARALTRRAIDTEKEHAERAGADAMDHIQYARLLLNCEPADLRDPTAALYHAQRAVQMTAARNPHFLDTLAHAYFATGQGANAAQTEEKALALLSPTGAFKGALGLRRELEANLSKFRLTLKAK
jgi:tetratricopeptide (TPR) repeat protein